MEPGEPDDETRPSLPPRAPRPFVVHWIIDSTVAFLVVLFPLLLLGTNLWPYIGAALIVGLAIAPTTHRKEIEALARRERGEPPDP